MTAPNGNMKHIATICHHVDQNCPKIFVDEEAAPERAVVVTDDFGSEIRMSRDQLGALNELAKSGKLEI